MIYPRVSEFGNVIKEIRKDLTNIVANDIDYTTILFGGSGTASIEL